MTDDQLMEDVRYVCNGRCSVDALVATVEYCRFVSKADETLLTRKLTIEQEEFLIWLFSDDGRTARKTMPDAFRGVDQELFGFDFFTPYQAFLERQSAGYTGDRKERVEWVRRRGEWEWAVCKPSVLSP